MKAVGVGAKNWRTIQVITRHIQLDWVMIANSMTLHSHPESLLEYMHELKNRDTQVINSAVFNGGFLTGGDYYNYKLVTGDNPEQKDLLQWRKRFFKACEQYNVLPAHACVQYGLNAPGVTSIALSTSRAVQVKGNIDLAAKKIDQCFWNALEEERLI